MYQDEFAFDEEEEHFHVWVSGEVSGRVAEDADPCRIPASGVQPGSQDVSPRVSKNLAIRGIIIIK